MLLCPPQSQKTPACHVDWVVLIWCSHLLCNLLYSAAVNTARFTHWKHEWTFVLSGAIIDCGFSLISVKLIAVLLVQAARVMKPKPECVFAFCFCWIRLSVIVRSSFLSTECFPLCMRFPTRKNIQLQKFNLIWSKKFANKERKMEE